MQLKIAHQRPRSSARADRAGRERGVSLIVTALLMVALLLMGAIVIDIGGAYAERRRDQSSADASALAAAQDLGNDSAAVATAISYANSSLGTTFTTADFDTCATDPGALAIRASGADCISFNTSRSRVRVRLPDQFHSTAFGGVVGVGQVRHTAFAVGAITQRGFGGVLPFGMPAGAGAGDGYACLKAASGGQSEAPCDGPDSGNFGTIDVTFFGNEDVGTLQSCGSGETLDRIANNIAVGSDHELSLYVTGQPEVVDTDACPETPGTNAANTQTGNNAGSVGLGLFSGGSPPFTDGGPARLKRTDENLFSGNGRTRDVYGQTVDDNPLWLFIPSSLVSASVTGGDVPRSCQRDQFVDGSDDPTMANLPPEVASHLGTLTEGDRMVALLARCMTHYRGLTWEGSAASSTSLAPAEPRTGCAPTSDASPVPCTDPVFGLNSSESESPNLWDIQYTPRFAYVPQLTGDFPSGGSQPVRFGAFRPVYIQRLSVQTSGSSDATFDPGFGPDPLGSSTKDKVREVTIWVFPDGMLPGELDSANAPYQIGVNRFVQLVR